MAEKKFDGINEITEFTKLMEFLRKAGEIFGWD
jgi:hypothetical protein